MTVSADGHVVRVGIRCKRRGHACRRSADSGCCCRVGGQRYGLPIVDVKAFDDVLDLRGGDAGGGDTGGGDTGGDTGGGDAGYTEE